jgi:hypothetical protein
MNKMLPSPISNYPVWRVSFALVIVCKCLPPVIRVLPLARAVDQMVSMCGTVEKLASVKSSYLPAMAKVALAACQDCETECRKHADQHAPCKACADACAVCAVECKKVSA